VEGFAPGYAGCTVWVIVCGLWGGLQHGEGPHGGLRARGTPLSVVVWGVVVVWIFITEDVLNTEKDHVEGFAPEVCPRP
jgi:hypothetical protein